MYNCAFVSIGLLCDRDIENDTTTTVTENATTALYENINPLVQSTDDPDYENLPDLVGDPDYENLPALVGDPDYVNLPALVGDPDYVNLQAFKMKKCPAYGVTTKTVK